MSEPLVAHTKPLNRTQNLTESRERFSSNTGVSGDVLSKKRFWLLDTVLTAEARLIDQWSLSSAWCGKSLLWDTSGCKFKGFIFVYVSKHATSLVTWIHTVCRAYETFYINEPPILTQLLEQALRLRNSSRKLIPVQWKKTTFKHMVQPSSRKWQSRFLFFNKVETEILSQSELKPLVWKRYIEDIFSLWTINRQNRTVHWASEQSSPYVQI